MATANSLEELFKMIQDKANSVLKNEIAILAVSTMQESVQEFVYDVYEPADPSKRRMYEDGLIDSRNIEISPIGDNGISVENIAYDGARNVPYIVESGVGYLPGASSVLTDGRKFTEATREYLRKSGRMEATMKAGLRKRGLDVK